MSWLTKLTLGLRPRFSKRKNASAPEIIDLSLVHLPSFSGIDGDLRCVYCGKLDDAPEHLHPSMKVGPFDIPRDLVPPWGTLTRVAARVIKEDPGAILMEESKRFPFVVFVQLTANDLLPKVRRALWWEKPVGVLCVVLRVGEIQYTLEEQEEWLDGAL
jgi:hypothetical protein